MLFVDLAARGMTITVVLLTCPGQQGVAQGDEEWFSHHASVLDCQISITVRGSDKPKMYISARDGKKKVFSARDGKMLVLKDRVDCGNFW